MKKILMSEVEKVINSMGDLTLEFIKNNNSMKKLSLDESYDIEMEKILRAEWLELNNEMVKLERELRILTNKELGDKYINDLMKKIRPDVY